MARTISAIQMLFVVAAAWSAAIPAVGVTVVFDDGNSHVVPGDAAFTNGDSIDVSSSSSLTVSDGAILIGESYGCNVMRCNSGSGGSSSGRTIILGGDIRGGDTHGARQEITGGRGFHQAGGSLPSEAGGIHFVGEGGTIAGGSATNDGGLDIDSNAYAGSGLYLGQTQAILSGTSVVGGSAYSSNSGVYSLSGARASSTGGDALYLNGYTTNVSAGSFVGGHANAHVEGFAEVPDLGPYSPSMAGAEGGLGSLVTGGVVTFEGSTIRGGSAVAVASRFESGAYARGGTALQIIDTSSGTQFDPKVQIFGGTFVGGDATAISESDWVVPIPNSRAEGGDGIEIFRLAEVVITGGTFIGGSAEAMSNSVAGRSTPGDGISVGTQIDGVLDVQITGGLFTGRYGLHTIQRSTSSSVLGEGIVIRGGNFEGLSGIDLSLNGVIPVTIVGRAFSIDGLDVRPGTVNATQGTLAGILQSGQQFEWDFARELATPFKIIEIPEPLALTIFCIGAVLVIAMRNRSPTRLGSRR